MKSFDDWFNEQDDTGCMLGLEGYASQKAWDYQQKKIDKLNSALKSALQVSKNVCIERDELQKRIDEVLKACDNLRTDLIRENHVEYDKGWKDCATSIYHQLKGGTK